MEISNFLQLPKTPVCRKKHNFGESDNIDELLEAAQDLGSSRKSWQVKEGLGSTRRPWHEVLYIEEASFSMTGCRKIEWTRLLGFSKQHETAGMKITLIKVKSSKPEMTVE